MREQDAVALWQTCFGDEAEIPAAFWRIPDVTLLPLEQEDCLLAMAGIVPVSLSTMQGCYLYAVCVSPTQRGQGYFRRIMQECEERARSQGLSFVCLIPADSRLGQTYRRMGYTTPVSLWKNRTEASMTVTLQSEGFRRLVQPWQEEATEATEGLLKWLIPTPPSDTLAFDAYMGET